jgi:hypothetical protein
MGRGSGFRLQVESVIPSVFVFSRVLSVLTLFRRRRHSSSSLVVVARRRRRRSSSLVVVFSVRPESLRPEWPLSSCSASVLAEA